MLLQETPDGEPILFPAWPKEWPVSFRLHTSDGRVVEASQKGDVDNPDFKGAQWIGAITRQAAHLPEGRTYSGSDLKKPEVKAAWEAVDTLSGKSIWLRKAITLNTTKKKQLRQATANICGLGFYELEVNNRKVGDAVLAPLWSDYDKTVWYNTYDVTDLFRAGQNELRVLLGNGFYNEQGGRYHKMKISFGPPTLLLRLHLEYSDGTSTDIVSDGSWQYALSPVVFNSIYGGEDYDARITPQWHPVVIQESPKGTLRRQLAAPVRIMETFGVKQRLTHVYDMGQNLSGFPQITVRGQRGQTVKLTMGETLTDDGHVSQKHTGRPHYHTYTLKGDGEETWHPHFSYYGFRYIEVETDAELLDLRSCFIYNSAPKIGEFECSNPLLNDAYRIIDRAVRSNWQAVWTDCPHREKLGWLEQDWLNGEGLVYNYDCRAMIEQTMQNIADAQHADGAVPTTAPQYTIFPGETWGKPFNESPEWGGAFIALPMLYLEHYGDDSLIRRYYEPMKRYVDYLATQDSCYILDQGLGDWYDYADGKAGFARNTSVRFCSTAHFYRWTRTLSEMADIIDHKADAQRYSRRADSIKAAINDTFYDATTHQYDTGSQCANAIALDLQLVPEADREAVMDNLVTDIHAHGDRLTTGDVGNRYLFRVLAYSDRREHHELLYRMLNHYDTPGYGYQLRRGHTTLTEQWNPDFGSSMNHFMMAHINNLLIPRLLGIETSGDGSSIKLRPMPVGDLTWCQGSTMCGKGKISCRWELQGRDFVLTCTLPAGTSALVTLPYSKKTVAVGDGLSTVHDTVPASF
ncbi:MAG: family 78 glycoside hydrolase catalytic domain [Prevotella sp.]|nr:family 78 glycoside hydrolase catalytic domain [Bacteroidaceae bacterium]MBR1415181.1 family 78 glycoside hydrolase catalytic domain [Prevotella sp.]